MSKGKKRRTRLIIEIATCVLPIFIIVAGLVAFLLYRNMMDIFLQAKQDMMSVQIEKTRQMYGNDDQYWTYDEWIKDTDLTVEPIFDKDTKVFDYYTTAHSDDGFFNNIWQDEWFYSLEDETLRNYAIKETYISNTYSLEYEFSQNSYDVVFLFMIQDDGSAVFYHDLCRDETIEAHRLGDRIKLDDSKHTDLRNMIKSGKNQIVFEKSKDFPHNGVYYNAYLPIIDKTGKVRAVLGIGYDWKEFFNQVIFSFIEAATVATMGIGFIFVILFVLIYFRAIEPVGKMQKSVREYIHTKDSSKVINTLRSIKTRNEIGQLSKNIRDLAVEIDEYTEDIVKMTGEKERVATELDMAKSIQEGQLPSTFPAFPDRSEFDIHASMIPAKEVGGDFYDFFFVDDDHLALVIADVSGKGVPAALFMMMSKMLIHQNAMLGLTPHEVIERVNKSICENNPQKMFVTVWLGILEISTGKVVACNAGHEYPVIRQPDGQFEIFKEPHGFVVGGLKNKKYKDYEFVLQKGGTLFVYTDGVPEATDSATELFGTERMTDSLNSDLSRNPEALISGLYESITGFVGDAPQFDDITMLAVNLKKE